MKTKAKAEVVTPVLTVLGTLYRESMKANGKSWTRLNGVLSNAMRDLIIAGVKFELEDVANALTKFGGGNWQNVEAWYSSACGESHGDGGGNRSAVNSLEKYLGRSPFLWAERTKTPQRLYVGATFTWKGERVTVTSFDDKRQTLTACSYTDDRDLDKNQVGGTCYAFGEYRMIEAFVDYLDGSIAARMSAKVSHDRKIKRRFCVSLEDLKAVRADYDCRRRTHEKAIAAATTLDELHIARDAARAEGANAYRHFDLEILTDLINAKHKSLTERMSAAEVRATEKKQNEAQIADWLAGKDSRPYFTGIIRLRIMGDFVECSNGNKVSLEAARSTLAFINKHRAKGWHTNGTSHDVDAFRLERVDNAGVQIGCTLIPWDEVDRFAPLLKAATKKAKRAPSQTAVTA